MIAASMQAAPPRPSASRPFRLVAGILALALAAAYGAPVAAHLLSDVICSGVSDGSLEKWPMPETANQGGIDLFCASAAMAAA